MSTACVWSDYINNYDQENVRYECGRNQVVNGFQSEHSSGREDRRWKVRCCGVSMMRLYIQHHGRCKKVDATEIFVTLINS